MLIAAVAVAVAGGTVIHPRGTQYRPPLFAFTQRLEANPCMRKIRNNGETLPGIDDAWL
jgi:hypothetical protein